MATARRAPSPATSRAKLLAVAGLSALVVVVIALRKSGPEPPAATEAVTREDVRPANIPTPAVTVASVGAEVAPPAPASAAQGPRRAPPPRALNAAHHALVEAATPCWRARTPQTDAGPPGSPDETMARLRFTYALVSLDGEAHPENVTVLDSSIADPALDHCVRAAIRAAKWPTDADDGVLMVEERVRMGDLTGYAVLPTSGDASDVVHAGDPSAPVPAR